MKLLCPQELPCWPVYQLRRDMDLTVKSRHRAQENHIRMKLPGDLAGRLRGVLEWHCRGYAHNVQSFDFAKIVGDVVRDAKGKFWI